MITSAADANVRLFHMSNHEIIIFCSNLIFGKIRTIFSSSIPRGKNTHEEYEYEYEYEWLANNFFAVIKI